MSSPASACFSLSSALASAELIGLFGLRREFEVAVILSSRACSPFSTMGDTEFMVRVQEPIPSVGAVPDVATQCLVVPRMVENEQPQNMFLDYITLVC
jgi:hypothetical protein